MALTLSVFSASTLAVPFAAPPALGLPTDNLAQPLLTDMAPLGSHSKIPSSFLKKRSYTNIDVFADTIVKLNTEIIVKAIVQLKLDLCTDIHAKLKIVASGLLNLDTGITIPKISARLDAEVDLTVNAKVDLDTQLLVVDKIRGHVDTAINRYCSRRDGECIARNAKKIVKLVQDLVKKDVVHLFVALKAELMAHVRAKVTVVLNELGINLVVEKITVAGFVDAVVQVDLQLHACAHVIVKGLHATVARNAVRALKSLIR
ncbi:hypothetical protein BGZ59_010588 [Podila verticillata]|nr:hypothetical protein BGZ59_010588 [Podila verticillata]KAI9239852.1 MAG: hypothetical protein BYD32DRAFT_434530 [Podila humilis]